MGRGVENAGYGGFADKWGGGFCSSKIEELERTLILWEGGGESRLEIISDWGGGVKAATGRGTSFPEEGGTEKN